MLTRGILQALVALLRRSLDLVRHRVAGLTHQPVLGLGARQQRPDRGIESLKELSPDQKR